MHRRRKIRKTTIIIYALSAFLAGLGVARFAPPLEVTWVWLCFAICLLAVRQSRWIYLLTVILLGLCVGWWRGGNVNSQLQTYQDLYGTKVVLQVTAENDAVYNERSQLSFDGSEVTILEPYGQKLLGRLKVEGFGEPAIYRDDVVRVEGKIFPTLGARQGRIQFAQLETLARDYSWIETTRHNFVAGIYSALPEPLASFGLGLLIGQRNTLPNQVTETLKFVGLTHIVAVSGYNLTILSRFARKLLRNRSKFQTFVASIILIGIFLLFTGFSASIVRAAIVAGLSLSAWYYGRKIRPLLLILIAAVLTTGWSPLYLWFDIGWHLSFLAFYGVLILAPLLIERFGRRSAEPKALTLLVVESLCAQIMTLPLILYIFHEASLISLVANVLVVPLVPLAMLLTLIAGLSGMFIPIGAGWLSWPANLILTYMLDISEFLSRIPRVLALVSIRLWQMIILYGLLGFVSLILWKRTASQRAKITSESSSS